jgi:hypothetical protein
MRDEGLIRRTALRLCVLAAQWLLCAGAAAEPYRYGDIPLGASLVRLERDLDLRDIHAAVATQQARQAPKPDLGRRGYGCVHRDDPYADIACVSHDERVGGAETREIRLHFLNGVLQQFSITSEIRHYDAVMQALREALGAPQRTEPSGAAWNNPDSRVVAHGGKDLVFVSFELVSYTEAVKMRQNRTRSQACQ